MKGPLCLLTSAAMLLNVPPATLADEIGYTGLEVIWPGQEGHSKFRGHHVQEIQQCCLRRGYALAMIEADPYGTPDLKIEPVQIFKNPEEVFKSTIDKKEGILLGESKQGFHACAWDGSQMLDPNGFINNGDNFYVKEALLLTKLL